MSAIYSEVRITWRMRTIFGHCNLVILDKRGAWLMVVCRYVQIVGRVKEMQVL